MLPVTLRPEPNFAVPCEAFGRRFGASEFGRVMKAE